MKRPNTHNKRKRERQLGALARAEKQRTDAAKKAVEALRKKLGLRGD